MDWIKIKAEYIAGGTSLRKLAEKHNVSFSTIQKRSMEEKWGELRKKSGRKTEEKIIDSVSTMEADKAVNIIDVADKLIEKIYKMLSEDYNTQNIKNLTSALKDLKDIKGYKSAKDLEEQDARIAKLRKEAERDDDSGVTEIEVVFKAGEEEWNE